MTPPTADHAVLQAAARWFACLHAAPDDAALQAQWNAWLAQDARHRQAWRQVESINERFGQVQRDSGQAQQVLGSLRQERQSRRRLLGSLCVAGAGSLLAWTGWQRGWVSSPRAWLASERTGLGEIRAVTLADGSRIWLNSDTALDVQFDSGVRQLWLYRGEVLIDTAPDTRPMQVLTRAGMMQPLGTRFSVLQRGVQTELSVFAGAVQATCVESGQQVRVDAGKALLFDAQQAGSLVAAPAQRQHWSRGVLVAEDMPLDQVLAVLRDYRHGYLGIDPKLTGLRAVGTFPLQDSDRALAMLERSLPIRVVRTLPWWVNVEPR